MSEHELLVIEPRSSSGCTVVVCRACCCGTQSKHPGTDHDGHLELLRDAASQRHGCQVRVSGCLNHCSYSNVIVVRPHGKDAHRRAIWFGNMHTDSEVETLAEWIRSGGPQIGEIPEVLQSRRIQMLNSAES